MKKNILAILLSCTMAGPALSANTGPAMQPAPKAALSTADTNSLNTWIAGKVAATRQPYCYRQSYGRGVGVPLSTCDANQQKNGLLCYPECKAGYGGAGPVCWQYCPSGYTDTGALCHISKSLTAAVHTSCSGKWPWEWHCSQSCPSGYTNVGAFCALNTPSVPAGYHGLTGLDLTKDSYGRGAGYPMKCSAGLQEDAGLCYSYCNGGYHGVGPVCWQNCPKDLTECGAGCANSTISCVSNTANMVIAPIALAANIFTAGSASKAAQAGEDAAKVAEDAGTLTKLKNTYTEIKTAYKAEIAAANTASKVASIGYTTGGAIDRWITDAVGNFRAITTNEVVTAMDQHFAGHKAAEDWAKRQYALQNLSMMMKDDLGATAQDALNIVATVDPTGVASVVAAYANPKCSSDAAFPSIKILY